MSDEMITIREIFMMKASEADQTTKDLNTLFADRSTVACLMAMGAIIGAMLRDQDENVRSEYSTMLATAIMMQLDTSLVAAPRTH